MAMFYVFGAKTYHKITVKKKNAHFGPILYIKGIRLNSTVKIRLGIKSHSAAVSKTV